MLFRSDNYNGADYASAIDACHELNLQLESAFTDAPLILTPATCGHTPTITGDGMVNGQETPGWVAFTMGLNMTRNPAGTVPVGLTEAGMPVGMQVIGRQRQDVTVLGAMATMEDLFNFTAKADLSAVL